MILTVQIAVLIMSIVSKDTNKYSKVLQMLRALIVNHKESFFSYFG